MYYEPIYIYVYQPSFHVLFLVALRSIMESVHVGAV